MSEQGKKLWTPDGMKTIAAKGDEKDLKDVGKATEQWDPDPLSNQVLLRKLPDEDLKTKGGIHLPETARNKMIIKGIVFKHGPGRLDPAGKLIPISVGEGDIVLASTYSTNTEIELNGEKFNLVREEDLLLRFKRKAKVARRMIVKPEEIDAVVTAWHAGAIDKPTLHDALGWTEAEYAAWVKDSKAIPTPPATPAPEVVATPASAPTPEPATAPTAP